MLKKLIQNLLKPHKPEITKNHYLNYKLDCLLLRKEPMSWEEFKKEYADKPYIEEDIF